MSIEIQNIIKKFGAFKALNNVSLDIATGKLVALLGPSGSGKTTLLRIIAGLEFADAGSVIFHGKDTTATHARERQVGFVFQHYALFRHMSVFDNIAFGLNVRPNATRPSKSEIKDRVYKLLKLIQLEPMAHRMPSQLSGGQRQRVALARALAVEPKVLLLDEPFGALDAKVRKDLRNWLRRLHDEISVTSVFVTHDQEEALEVADRVVVMNQGAIEQIGTPESVYAQPASPFVYNFLGNVNLFHGRVDDGKIQIGDATLGDASSSIANTSLNSSAPNGKARIFVRPHALDLSHERPADGHLKARIAHINAAGPLVRVELLNDERKEIFVELSQERYRALALKKGEDVYVQAREVKVFMDDYAI